LFEFKVSKREARRSSVKLSRLVVLLEVCLLNGFINLRVVAYGGQVRDSLGSQGVARFTLRVLGAHAEDTRVVD